MRVFISFSGRRSQRIAEAFGTAWFPAAFGGAVTTFLSFSGIQKGEDWFARLTIELQAADAALVCLTPENLASPWVHFEAGMVSRMGRGRVFTYFLGEEAAAIKDPLKQVQVTVATKADTAHLAASLAALGGMSMSDVAPRLDGAWTALEAVMRDAGPVQMDDLVPGFELMFAGAAFSDAIDASTDQRWVERFASVHDVVRTLAAHREVVVAAVAPWQAWIYDNLSRHVTAYADALCEHLLVERRFDFDDAGRLDFATPRTPRVEPAPARLGAVCQRLCREIRHDVFCLSRMAGAPVLPSALAFSRLPLDQLNDKKKMIHARGLHVDWRTLGLGREADLDRCAESMWDFDRIMFYCAVDAASIAPARMLGLAWQELERARADEGGTNMPLHYAVKALARVLRRGTADLDCREAVRFAHAVGAYLDESGPADRHPEIRQNLGDIRDALGAA